jgi:hypothetical protein
LEVPRFANDAGLRSLLWVVVVAHVPHSWALARTLFFQLLLAYSPTPFARLGKFDSPSEGDPTVFFHRHQRESASGTAHSIDPRVIHCMALETWVDYFAY